MRRSVQRRDEADLCDSPTGRLGHLHILSRAGDPRESVSSESSPRGSSVPRGSSPTHATGQGMVNAHATTLHAQMFTLSRHAPTPDGPRGHTPPCAQQAITTDDESFYVKLFNDIESLSNGGSAQLQLGGIEDMLVKVSQGRQGSAEGLASINIKFSSLRSSRCKVAGIEMAVVYALALRRPRWLPHPSRSRPHSHSVTGCGRYATWTIGLRRTRRGLSRGSATHSG